MADPNNTIPNAGNNLQPIPFAQNEQPQGQQPVAAGPAIAEPIDPAIAKSIDPAIAKPKDLFTGQQPVAAGPAIAKAIKLYKDERLQISCSDTFNNMKQCKCLQYDDQLDDEPWEFPGSDCLCSPCVNPYHHLRQLRPRTERKKKFPRYCLDMHWCLASLTCGECLGGVGSLILDAVTLASNTLSGSSGGAGGICANTAGCIGLHCTGEVDTGCNQTCCTTLCCFPCALSVAREKYKPLSDKRLEGIALLKSGLRNAAPPESDGMLRF